MHRPLARPSDQVGFKYIHLLNTIISGDPQSNAVNNLSLIAAQYQPQQPQQTNLVAQNGVAGLANALYSGYATSSTPATTAYRHLTTSPPEQTAILQLGHSLAGVPQEGVPYVNFANMVSIKLYSVLEFKLVFVHELAFATCLVARHLNSFVILAKFPGF
jgi:hypothetical protein